MCRYGLFGAVQWVAVGGGLMLGLTNGALVLALLRWSHTLFIIISIITEDQEREEGAEREEREEEEEEEEEEETIETDIDHKVPNDLLLREHGGGLDGRRDGGGGRGSGAPGVQQRPRSMRPMHQHRPSRL